MNNEPDILWYFVALISEFVVIKMFSFLKSHACKEGGGIKNKVTASNLETERLQSSFETHFLKIRGL